MHEITSFFLASRVGRPLNNDGASTASGVHLETPLSAVVLYGI